MRSFSVSILALCLLAACDTNDSGNLAASTYPQLSVDVLEMSGPPARAECGDGTPTLLGLTTLGRLPYLQRVGDRSAWILWAARREDFWVELTDLDGNPVGRQLGEPDPGSGDARMRVARFDDLEPATTYCYEVRSPDGAIVERTGFRTAPSVGDEQPIELIAFGDSGTGSEDQLTLARYIAAAPYDLVLHTGDVVYGGGTRELYDAHFFHPYASVLSSVPAFLASGNHDYESGLKGFLEVFALPENGTEEGRERWYSFDWGVAHIVALDTERDIPAQVEWLERDLAANQQPWTIVFAHKPPYSSGEHGSDLEVREAFGPIYERYGVQLVLNGHEHHYERTLPINGVTYVITGGGGRGTRTVGSSEFTARSEAVIHFVHVTIDGDELTVRAIDGTGSVFDAVVIGR